MGIGRRSFEGEAGAATLASLSAVRDTALIRTRSDFDRGLTVIEANPAFFEITGQSPEEVIGSPLSASLIPPDDALSELQRQIEGEGAGRLEARPVTANGRDTRLEVEVARTGESELLAIAHDVTEHRVTARRLESALELLAMAAATSTVGVWQADPDSDVVECNETMYELFGLDPERPLTRPQWLQRIHPQDRSRLTDAFSERWLGSEVTLRARGPRDETRQVLVRGKPISFGRREALVGIAVDITESQQAARRVIETLESITDAYFALDHDWCFTYVNSEAERVLSKRREELLGRDIRTALPEAVESVGEHYREALDDDRVAIFEWYYEPGRRWFEVRAYPLPDGVGVYFRDVTSRHDAEAEMERVLEAEQEARLSAEMAQRALEYQATHDSLTHLLNRGELIKRLDRALDSGRNATVLFVDLDRFKLVNDSLGHAVGDEMLEQVAARLAELESPSSLVARIGGDEFVIVLIESDNDRATATADSVLDTLRDPVWIDGHWLNTTASIGISSSAPRSTAEDLLRDADVALYRAKDFGGDEWVWFDEAARLEVLRRVSIERDLHDAIFSDQLELYYQPAYDLDSGAATNVESLLRWHHPRHGMVSPEQFIPIAEESGLILPIGRWVLRQTLADARPWLDDDDTAVWANVSIRQLRRPGLADLIALELEAAGVEPAQFGIEITESVLADQDTVIAELGGISELGVRIAIDDFGTGYSSISRLSNLPVDVLKVDQSFIQDIQSPGGVDTVKAIVDLGHALDCLVIAEGVETAEQLELLKMTGCDQAGGFYFCRPVPSAELGPTWGRGREILADRAYRKDGSDGT